MTQTYFAILTAAGHLVRGVQVGGVTISLGNIGMAIVAFAVAAAFGDGASTRLGLKNDAGTQGVRLFGHQVGVARRLCLVRDELAAVEFEPAQFLRGETSTEYARNLEHDVPRLVAEAWDLRTGF